MGVDIKPRLCARLQSSYLYRIYSTLSHSRQPQTRNSPFTTMFHIVLAIASRFLYFGNALQGFARGILALRNLAAISSHIIPAISPPPPIALLDAPVPFVGLPEEIISPYSSALIALERIERQPPPFASPIPSYQSSLITASPSQLPIFLPLFIILLAFISGFVIVLPEI